MVVPTTVVIVKEVSFVCACGKPCAFDTTVHPPLNANNSHSELLVHMQQLLNRTIEHTRHGNLSHHSVTARFAMEYMAKLCSAQLFKKAFGGYIISTMIAHQVHSINNSTCVALRANVSMEKRCLWRLAMYCALLHHSDF